MERELAIRSIFPVFPPMIFVAASVVFAPRHFANQTPHGRFPHTGPADTDESDPDNAIQGMYPMKRALLLVAFVCLTNFGCQIHTRHMAKDGCQDCGPGGKGQYASCHAQRRADYVPQIPHHYYKQVGPAGPPTAAYAYPYYTTRGPRDFFLNNPSTIGY
jgi:hypothetical protein